MNVSQHIISQLRDGAWRKRKRKAARGYKATQNLSLFHDGLQTWSQDHI
jgi:hypothetical protein